ncbi:MAG: cyclic nucleotide-binding domain-containing protein [Desulfatiglans sp.]|jgi:CRP-like cAMP-binding protein|nr:cyclic nucleotide-binding domain-containing protein [Desulfatiglans sp.]
MSIEKYLYPYITQEEEYEKGEAIIKEGSRGDWVYIILEGLVKIKKMSLKGQITIAPLTEGEIFGEATLWQAGQGVTRNVSIVAETRTRVGLLDTALLLKEYESISPRLKSLISSLIQRLTITTQKAVRLATE